MSELPAPPDAERDPTAMELLRAWLIGDALHCSLLAGAFEDPAAWGAVLADVARYVAEARAELDGTDPAQTLVAIRQAFGHDLDHPPQDA